MSQIHPKPLPPLLTTDVERFWRWVNIGQAGECWPWRGSTESNGYGRFAMWVNHRTVILRAHRVAAILSGMDQAHCALHTCDNPPCCNPSHLFGGSLLDNIADRHRKGRSNTARGEASARAKLKKEQVLAIRERIQSGEIHRLIAADMHVAIQTIRAIAYRRIWNHV